MRKIVTYVKLKHALENMDYPSFGEALNNSTTREEASEEYDKEVDNYFTNSNIVSEMKTNLSKDKEEILSYWLWILADYRYYPREKMLWVLADRMKLSYMEYVSRQGLRTIMSIEDFAYEKRPYGNKDVPASILYNLGLDRYDVLDFASVPEEIQEWCMKLHEEVIEYMKESTFY